MKTLRMTILGIAALCCATAATAQTALDKAFPDFIARNADTNILLKTSESQDDNGKKCTFCCYVFRVKKNDSTLAALRKAFAKDESEAYSVFNRVKGSNLYEIKRIGYGIDPNNGATGVTFGDHDEYNDIVLLFRDKTDGAWRTCYALTWCDDPDEDKCYKGSLYKIYSRDPKTIAKNGKTSTIKVLDNSTLLQLDNLTGDMRMLNAGSQSGTVVKVSSSAEFVMRLNNLRTMYNGRLTKDNAKHADEQATTIVNVILAMCKQKAKLLDADEKQACVGILHEMQQNSTDNSLKDLLGLAVKYLK